MICGACGSINIDTKLVHERGHYEGALTCTECGHSVSREAEDICALIDALVSDMAEVVKE